MDQRELDARFRVLLKNGEPDITDEEAAQQIYAAVSARQCVDLATNGERASLHEGNSATRPKPHTPRGRRRVVLTALAAIVALSAATVGVLEAVNHLGAPQPIMVIGDDTSSISGVGTTLSPNEAAQQWYAQGLYHGFWAGNVETIPAKPSDLPDFFFSGPTPIGPIGRELKDPSTIKKPLWIFGDEVRVSDYKTEIRQAMKDGRPILFYATNIGDAVAVLGLSQQVSTDTPLERLIVIWPSGTAGDKAVDASAFTLKAPRPASIFGNLVYATLGGGVEDTNTTSTSYMQAPATLPNSGATTTDTNLQQEKMKWGEAAAVEGGAITVGLPVEDPTVQVTQPGFRGVYSIVTITNTSTSTIKYGASDFSLEGQSSGSVGTHARQGSMSGGYPAMNAGSLDPGETITYTVRFELHGADVPIKVRLVPQWAKQVLVSWQ